MASQLLSMANITMKEAQANPRLACSLAKFPAEVTYSYYLLLATLWYPCTKVQDDLASLLRLPNKATWAYVRSPMNQPMFQSLEQATEGPYLFSVIWTGSWRPPSTA